jgi:dTMP kinase
MSKGLFITLEGGEGSSKTTQAKLLQQHYIQKGMDVVLTREPGGTSFGEALRSQILTSQLDPVTMLFAMMAARSKHICEVIRPALKRNSVVICDRFIDSTACYQSQDEFLSIEKIYTIHQDIFNNLLPDITIFLKLSPQIALKRAQERSDNIPDVIEAKDIKYHTCVYEKYLKVAQMFPERIVSVEANGSILQIHQNILLELSKRQI